jgi:hypothetical protein
MRRGLSLFQMPLISTVPIMPTRKRSFMKRVAVILLVVGALGAGACGGEDAASSTTQPAAPSTTEVGASSTALPTSAPGVTPDDLGDMIGEVYLAGFGDVVALLIDRPDPATAAAELSALKEQYIEELVALGRLREGLSPADRAIVDARIGAALNRIPADVFAGYQQALTDYESDSESAALIRDFNIIGQYANFDLLREQEPEEAARLGLG